MLIIIGRLSSERPYILRVKRLKSFMNTSGIICRLDCCYWLSAVLMVKCCLIELIIYLRLSCTNVVEFSLDYWALNCLYGITEKDSSNCEFWDWLKLKLWLFETSSIIESCIGEDFLWEIPCPKENDIFWLWSIPFPSILCGNSFDWSAALLKVGNNGGGLCVYGFLVGWIGIGFYFF